MPKEIKDHLFDLENVGEDCDYVMVNKQGETEFDEEMEEDDE